MITKTHSNARLTFCLPMLGLPLTLLFSLVGYVSLAGAPQFEVKQTRYNDGESQMAKIQKEGEHPRYGKCWLNALTKVTEGCKRLTDDEQSRMALALTNCHLEKAGFTLYPCDDEQTISSCLSPMQTDGVAFNAYTEFFTHTQNICFFLQNQVWHEKTEQTVSKLAESSEIVADQLQVTSHLQAEMMQKQNTSIQNQNVILQNEEYLREALKSSAESVKDVFEEMKSSTNQQKLLFEKTFERVSEVQRIILGEFTWLHSLLFYTAAVLIIYMLTSTPRTSGARLWLFLVLASSWLTERALFSWFEESNEDTVYYNLWFCRKVFCVVCLLVLVVFAVMYKDYTQINHQLLLDLHRKLENMVEDNSLHSKVGADLSPLAVQAPSSLHAITSPYDETKDLTFIPNQLEYSGDSDTESYITAGPGSRKTSRPNTPAILGPDDSIMTTSPADESELGLNGTSVTLTNGDISVSVRKRGRSKESKKRWSREPTPLRTTIYQTPYNLRSRSRQSTPNPVLKAETVDMFMAAVEARLRSSSSRR